MTWTDPLATAFETGDVLTEANLSTYVLNNLLSIPHPLEAPTTADLDVNTTTTETTLYSVTVGANKMGSNGQVVMDVEGDWLYNNNTADNMTLRIKFGGVTSISAAQTLGSLNASRVPYVLRITASNRGATNAQLISLTMLSSDAGAGTGIGQWHGGSAEGGAMQTTAAIDTTVNQTLLISVQWSASSANDSWRRRWARTTIAQN